MKTVCIIGAGPAGLVGAKTLIKNGNFDVTIYERTDRIGGIWAIDKDSKNAFLSPETPTNISKFSVGFSDFRWENLDFATNEQNGSSKPHKVPMFPKAWQVNRYLEAYRSKYIPGHVFNFNSEVIRVERADAESTSSPWKVTIRDEQSVEKIKHFDFLLLASGFFSKPRPLGLNVTVDSELHVKPIHSSQYKGLKNLFQEPQAVSGNAILVIGGGNSSGEGAAAVAQHVSDASWSPVTGREQKYENMKIIHVTPHPVYAVPPYCPVDDRSCSFLPIDLKLYDFSRRAKGNIVANAGQVPKEVKDMVHSFVQGIIGSDQSDLGSPAMLIPTSEPRKTAQIALSESYPEFVRSGLIEVLRGRVVALENGPDGTAIAKVKNDSGSQEVGRIIGIVYATGYSPASALDFLSDEIKDALQYDASSFRLPIILEGWQTSSKAFPDLALLGFYEGPYWGMIEMQARLTTQRWASCGPIPERPYEENTKMMALRDAMRDRRLSVPQYWFNDYLGYLDEIATYLHLNRNNGPFEDYEGCTSPARYTSPETDNAEADQIIQDLYNTWHECIDEGKGVARAVFRALQGHWAMHRTIESALPSFPSGVVDGVASFHPRAPTLDESGQEFDLEYLYVESGTLTLSNGASMTVRKRYVYRYSEANDELSAWFVKPNNDLEVDYRFHNFCFVPPEEAQNSGACIARADHLCVKDMYWTEYRLPMKGISLHDFETKHTVKGPHKDYVSNTKYTRPTRCED